MLVSYTLEGKPIFEMGRDEDQELLERVLHYADTLPGDTHNVEGMESRENMLKRTQGKSIVTDDTMGTRP